MKKSILHPLATILVFLACGCARLHAWQAVLFNPTNGVIVIPSNFVSANLASVPVTNNFSGTATNLTGNATNQVLALISNSVPANISSAVGTNVTLTDPTFPNNPATGVNFHFGLFNGFIGNTNYPEALSLSNSLGNITYNVNGETFYAATNTTGRTPKYDVLRIVLLGGTIFKLAHDLTANGNDFGWLGGDLFVARDLYVGRDIYDSIGKVPPSNLIQTNFPVATKTFWVSSDGLPFGNSAAGIPFGSAAFTTNNLTAAVRLTITNGGTIYIGPGVFASWPTNLLCPFPNTAQNTNFTGTNDLWIVGCRRPAFNLGETNFSQFTDTNGATILQGTLRANRPNLHFKNFGVDCGKVVCTNLGGGLPLEVINICANNPTWSATGQEGWSTNTVNANCSIENVSTLGYETNSPIHGLLFENVLHCWVKNIWTYSSGHGLVIKGWDVAASEIHSTGHYLAAVNIKVNNYALPGMRDAGFRTAPAQGSGLVSVNNVTIADLRRPGDTMGLMLDSLQSTIGLLSQITVSSYTYFGTNSAVVLNADATYAITGVNIQVGGWDYINGSAVHISKQGTLAQVYVNGVAQ